MHTNPNPNPMKNLYLLAALALSLTGCDAMKKQALKGTYQNTEKAGMFRIVDHVEITETKFILGTRMGDQATEYKVEDGYVYAGPDAAQVRFKIVGADTLRNEGNLGYEGIYVRVK